VNTERIKELASAADTAAQNVAKAADALSDVQDLAFAYYRSGPEWDALTEALKAWRTATAAVLAELDVAGACPRCEGTGAFGWTADARGAGVGTCSACGGTGKGPAPETEHAYAAGAIKLSPTERLILIGLRERKRLEITSYSEQGWIDVCAGLTRRGLICGTYVLSNMGAEVAAIVGAP
jgi:hypothetical protein